MTPQEAIGSLHKIPVRPKPDNALDMQAIIMAVKALELKSKLDEMDLTIEDIKAMNEKRIPKNVIFMSDKSKVCGRCKQRVLRYQPYCEDCGQALDWNDEE